MRPLISPDAMLRIERQYFSDSGVPSIDIMERAAMAIARTVIQRYPGSKRVCIACGPGGNGGDGYACARLLSERGRICYVFAAAPAASSDAAENARRARESGVEILDTDRLEGMPLPDLWIDCLFGTGLSRSPQGAYALLIEKMNRDREKGAAVIACDIPSGLNGRTGKAYDPCVQADITITFQRAKQGHFLQDGLDACGEIMIADVGFPGEIFREETGVQLFEPEDLSPVFSPRRRNIHKGKCGHLLIVAGSTGMAGAAALCAGAALRSGAGLVTIACPAEIVPILQIHAPGAMCLPLPSLGGALSPDALPLLQSAFAGKSAIAAGPGLRRSCAPEIIGAILKSGLPAVLDADALNIISDHGELKEKLSSLHIITPHPGEAARLLGRECTDPVADALALSETGACAVLKGASRVIAASGAARISSSGASGMARGGSGDVLTGIMGALMAEASSCTNAETAAAACEIHGLAGKLAQDKYGPRAMNSADIIVFLPEVFREYVDR